MTPKEELIAARTMIAERGTVARQIFYDRPTNCACMIGALLIAKGFRTDGNLLDTGGILSNEATAALYTDDPALRALIEAIGGNDVIHVYLFNDAHPVTKILAAFDKAIASVES